MLQTLLGQEQTTRNREREREIICLGLRAQILGEIPETLDRLQRVGRAYGDPHRFMRSLVEVDGRLVRQSRKHWFIIANSGLAGSSPLWWRLFGERSVAPMTFWMRDDGVIVSNVRSTDLKLRSITARANLEPLDQYDLDHLLRALPAA